MERHERKIFCIFLILFSFSRAGEFSQDPHIEIYAKSQLTSTGKVSYKILHVGNNSETIINPLYFDEVTNQWIGKPNEDAKISATLQMDCLAPYAVEWNYEGDGLTDNVDQKDYPYNFKHVSVTATRVVKPESFWNASTYTFKAQISNIFIREKLTGNYSCRSIENNTILTWMYVYFPENSKSFANPDENRQILLHDRDQIIILPENSESLILPCSVSSPKSKISLFKISSRGSFEKVFIDPPELEFDPKKGFVFSNLNYTYLLGTYLCRAENFRSIQIFVFPPKEFVGKFSPEVSYVPIVPGESQKFECKARENITLVFTEEDFPMELVEYKFSPHGKFPFSVSVTLNPSDVRKFIRINCTTRSSKQVLTMWEYSYFKNEIQIRYDVPSHRVLCCADSYKLPKFKALQCHSEMECRLKRNFLFDVIEKDPPMTETPSPIPFGCVSLMWVISEGKLDCSLDFKNKAVDLVNFHGFISVDPEEIPVSEDVMRIQHDIPIINDKPRDILLGEIFSFYCEASPKYFATGSFYVKFGLFRENGSMEILEAPHCRLKSCGPNSGIKFDDVNITKVFCFAPLYNSSTEWRNISLPVRVTDKAPITIRAVLADKRDGVSFPLMDIANTDIILRETAMFRNRRLRLECESPFQTIWEYQGMGSPVVKGLSNVSELFGHDESTTYKFYSAIEFIKVTDIISGKYSCVVKDKPRLRSYFRVFVPGITAFLSLDAKTISVTNVDLVLLNNVVTIPCPVSDTAHVVTLLAESAEFRNQWMVVTPDENINYDPLKGFEIQTSKYDLPWNTTYICKTDSGHTSGKIQMISPNEPQFKIIPNSIYADNTPRLKPAVRCEAKKNVTLTFSGTSKRRQIMHETDFDSEFPYIVSYFPLLLEDDTDYENRFTLINCTTIEDQTVLHTWSYTPGNYYKPPLTYYYDQDKVRYICCTNSHAPAMLRYVPCSEISECNVRKSCLAHNTCGSQPDLEKIHYEDLKEDCVGFSIIEKNEGLLRCSVAGIYQEHIFKDFIYSHNRNDSENQGKSDLFQEGDDILPSQRFDKDKTSENRFKIVPSTPDEKVIVGSSVAFDCYAPQCEEKGLQWSLLTKNGSIIYINGYDDYKSDAGEERQHGWTHVTFDNDEISGIRCFHRNVTCNEKWSGLTWNVTYVQIQDDDYDATTTNEPPLIFFSA